MSKSKNRLTLHIHLSSLKAALSWVCDDLRAFWRTFLLMVILTSKMDVLWMTYPNSDTYIYIYIHCKHIQDIYPPCLQNNGVDLFKKPLSKSLQKPHPMVGKFPKNISPATKLFKEFRCISMKLVGSHFHLHGHCRCKNHQANGKSIAAVQRKLQCFTSIASTHHDHHQTWWRKWDKLHQSPTTNSCETAIQKEKNKKLPTLQPGYPPPVLFFASPQKNLTLGGDFFSQASSRLEALNMVFSITRLLQSNNPGWYAPWNYQQVYTWKLIVVILVSFWGPAYFQGRTYLGLWWNWLWNCQCVTRKGHTQQFGSCFFRISTHRQNRKHRCIIRSEGKLRFLSSRVDFENPESSRFSIYWISVFVKHVLYVEWEYGQVDRPHLTFYFYIPGILKKVIQLRQPFLLFSIWSSSTLQNHWNLLA